LILKSVVLDINEKFSNFNIIVLPVDSGVLVALKNIENPD
jgi:hypothetical protein